MIDCEIKFVLFLCCGNENRDGDVEDNVDKNYFIIFIDVVFGVVIFIFIFIVWK